MKNKLLSIYYSYDVDAFTPGFYDHKLFNHFQFLRYKIADIKNIAQWGYETSFTNEERDAWYAPESVEIEQPKVRTRRNSRGQFVAAGQLLVNYYA